MEMNRYESEILKSKIDEALLKAEDASIRSNGAELKGNEAVRKIEKRPTYMDTILIAFIMTIVGIALNGYLFDFPHKDATGRLIFEQEERIQTLEAEIQTLKAKLDP